MTPRERAELLVSDWDRGDRDDDATLIAGVAKAIEDAVDEAIETEREAALSDAREQGYTESGYET